MARISGKAWLEKNDPEGRRSLRKPRRPRAELLLERIERERKKIARPT